MQFTNQDHTVGLSLGTTQEPKEELLEQLSKFDISLLEEAENQVMSKANSKQTRLEILEFGENNMIQKIIGSQLVQM